MMKYRVLIITLLLCLKGITQVVPNVSIDSLTSRIFPVVMEALRSGVYDLPRDTSWQYLQHYESEILSLEVPDKWLNLGGLGSVVQVAFDGSGLYFQESMNDRPVLVGVFLLNVAGGSLEEVKETTLKEYRANTDRIFEPEYVDPVYTFTLTGGIKSYLLHTRFFRKSNQLNQSRYDLIIFSEKVGKGFSVMLSVQYADPTYSFEKTNAIDALAARVFNRVVLR